jgi:hypothetical protein
MASEALSIPPDISWQRLAWSPDMVAIRGASMPFKWHSSMAVYAYPVPLSETEDEYPDHRIVYFKLSLTITGWTRDEAIPQSSELPTGLDEFQRSAFDEIRNVPALAAYLPCLSAIAQFAVYPRTADGTPLDQYPYIVDFEPKKRELYEAVSDTKELLSGSSGNLNTKTGHTTTRSTEAHVSATVKGFIVPGIGGSATAGAGKKWTNEEVDLTTTDASTERRETVGRTTQLSQMYQLFNGYHTGTNRAVFVMFPRPHTKTKADDEETEANLIGGERRLEGIQDIFLVVQVPKEAEGLCVESWLDTSHTEVAALLRPRLEGAGDDEGVGGPDGAAGTEEDGGSGTSGGSGGSSLPPKSMVITRRIVGGCAAFDGDRLRPDPIPPGTPPRTPPVVVGETLLPPGLVVDGFRAGAAVPNSTPTRVSAADHLNLVQHQVRRVALASTGTSRYAPRQYVETNAFRSLAAQALRATRVGLDQLVKLHYASKDEADALWKLRVRDSGDLFAATTKAQPPVLSAVRERLLDAALKLFAPRK